MRAPAEESKNNKNPAAACTGMGRSKGFLLLIVAVVVMLVAVVALLM